MERTKLNPIFEAVFQTGDRSHRSHTVCACIAQCWRTWTRLVCCLLSC